MQEELTYLRREVRSATESALRAAARFPLSRDVVLERIVLCGLRRGEAEASVVAYACAAELRLTLSPHWIEHCGRLARQSSSPALRALYWAASRRFALERLPARRRAKK